jgi:hypothetical protein
MRLERATRSISPGPTEPRPGTVEGAAFADLLAKALAHAPLLAPAHGTGTRAAHGPNLAAPLNEATLLRAAAARRTLVVRVPAGPGVPAQIVASVGPSGVGVAVTLDGAHMRRGGDVSRVVEARLRGAGGRTATVRVRRAERPAKEGDER